MGQRYRENEKKNKKKIIILLVLLFVITAAAAGGWFYYNNVLNANNKLLVDSSVGDYEESSSTSSSSGVSVPGWKNLVIPAGKTTVPLTLNNPSSNEGKYYLTFELVLEDSGESLGKTGLVPPGQATSELKLNHAMEAGTYKAIVKVQPYLMNEAQSATKNSSSMKTNLVVQ